METDLLVVGGGINGVGIARDGAGRGLGVVLCDAGDLGGATSSASSKLAHGGLRYLEQFEFRLVAEALHEREVLLRAAPHLVRPMRFVLPRAPGLRAAWILRAGLFLYDNLARRQTLAKSGSVDLTAAPYRESLKREYTRGYAYSDCWVDDARLVIANARAAVESGATVLPRTHCVAAAREGAHWRAELQSLRARFNIRARAIVNATGAHAERFLRETVGLSSAHRLKLVQGSHIVVPRLYSGEHAYILQNDDGRVVFVYPYEGAYTLVGTTDVEMTDPNACGVTPTEVDYLCRAANRYFVRQISSRDVHWSYCGVRALVDDGTGNPAKMTRDYSLLADASPGRAPIVSVYGGKITTYRRLAERVLDKLAPDLAPFARPWTSEATLTGGDIPYGDIARFRDTLARERSGLPERLLSDLVARHGSRARSVLGEATSEHDLGEHFGAQLYAREVDYLIAHEWATHGDDVLWRRTKAGLHLSREQQTRVVQYVSARVGGCVR